jgi:hypothetical protein
VLGRAVAVSPRVPLTFRFPPTLRVCSPVLSVPAVTVRSLTVVVSPLRVKAPLPLISRS